MNTSSAGGALRRRDEILRVVRSEAIRSQEELAERLARRGFVVTQPTLSRDLKDLGVAKMARGYVVPDPGESGEGPLREQSEERLARLFRTFVLGVRRAGNLVVVRTPPADAHPVARAMDEAALDHVVGTVAGDDTIFVATAGPAEAARVAHRLESFLSPEGRPRRLRARRHPGGEP